MKNKTTVVIGLWVLVCLCAVKFFAGDWIAKQARSASSRVHVEKPKPQPQDDSRIAALERRVEALVAALEAKAGPAKVKPLVEDQLAFSGMSMSNTISVYTTNTPAVSVVWATNYTTMITNVLWTRYSESGGGLTNMVTFYTR